MIKELAQGKKKKKQKQKHITLAGEESQERLPKKRLVKLNPEG